MRDDEHDLVWTPSERAKLDSLPRERFASDMLRVRTVTALRRQQLIGRGHNSKWKHVAWLAVAAGVVFVALVSVVSGFLGRSDLVDLGVALGVGVIALSLVPLVGFAGQISLCQMSLAAIGAMMMAQFGGDGSLCAVQPGNGR